MFASVAKFCHIVAANKAHMLYSLACIVAYNVAAHNKMLKKYFKWKQISQNNLNTPNKLTKDYTHTKAKLYQSQREDIEMQQKWDELEKDILLTETQLKVVNPGLEAKVIEIQHTQAESKVELERKCQQKIYAQVDLKLTIVQIEFLEKWLAKAKQKAKSSTISANIASIAGIANEANVASKAGIVYMVNTANNYQLHGTEPKTQLIETNIIAYAPWKWAVKKKLQINATIYLTKIDCISYAFSKLALSIFQQLKVWIQTNLENLTMAKFFKEI